MWIHNHRWSTQKIGSYKIWIHDEFPIYNIMINQEIPKRIEDTRSYYFHTHIYIYVRWISLMVCRFPSPDRILLLSIDGWILKPRYANCLTMFASRYKCVCVGMIRCCSHSSLDDWIGVFMIDIVLFPYRFSISKYSSICCFY